MWQKIQSMWAYAYDNHIDEYDWFHICGDDVYMQLDNFRSYLTSEDIAKHKRGYIDIFHRNNRLPKSYQNKVLTNEDRPLYLGMPWIYGNKRPTWELYNAGGSGYTLNRAALKVLVEDGLPNAKSARDTDSKEDVLVGQILNSFGISPIDTRDEFGGFRYIPSHPLLFLTKFIGWKFGSGENAPVPKDDIATHISTEALGIYLDRKKLRKSQQKRHLCRIRKQMMLNFCTVYMIFSVANVTDVYNKRKISHNSRDNFPNICQVS